MKFSAMKFPSLFWWVPTGCWLIVLLNGCSMLPVHYELPNAGGMDCGAELSRLDTDIARYSYFDPALQRIPDEPLLRSNRFIASFASPSLRGQELQHWMQQMNTLAVNAYRIEFSRLPEQVQIDWKARHPDGLESMLTQCSKTYLSVADTRALSFIEKVQPEDNYSTAQRFWGIYTLTKRLAASRIEAYRTEMTMRIQSGSSRQFIDQIVYSPLTEVTPAFNQSDSEALTASLLRHAPELLVEHTSNADEVGSPVWKNEDEISVDTEKPQAFTYISYTRYKSEILTQLNYVYWFSGRPKKSSGDLYGGNLDALVWRVTLNSQGKPVLYDSIHACGCYHLLFLPSGTEIDVQKIENEKPLVFPMPSTENADPTAPSHLQLKIEAESHYLIAVLAKPASQNGIDDINPATMKPSVNSRVYHYSLQSYQTLLSMPATPNRRSLFGADGIVAQSSRLERFILWPLGIPNAGAMREAGTHAIAFIGKRHFDDAWLFDELGLYLE